MKRKKRETKKSKINKQKRRLVVDVREVVVDVREVVVDVGEVCRDNRDCMMVAHKSYSFMISIIFNKKSNKIIWCLNN